MGVPALFRWLSKKYPKIVASVVEEEATTVPDALGNPLELPVDISSPNPNGVELDNLYLDMNGIVHPCTHPEGRPAPETEEEMMIEVFRYTERVVNMVRPRKLLFMAIDGVAPRAKMNQQRSRRFRSAQEAKEKEEERKEAIAIFEAMGHTVSDETKEKKSWDSNAITPGTPFMTLLANSLRYWVVQKMNTDPGWKNLQVIISDASVPGEGEHKIMDWIRRQRVGPDHDPNTQHVIYGLDADLIMLALATHEPHFRVLREDVFAQDKNSRACRICGQEGHLAAQCTGEKKFNLGNENKENKETKPVEKKPFIFLDVSILREYLEIELNVPQSTFPFDLEVAIDDWIFLIFLVGNDFLPHLPSLEIREGAIDTLLKIWKKELSRMGGYVTNHGHVVLDRAQVILEGLSSRENEIFKKRREAEERQDQNAKRRKIDEQNRQNNTNGRNTPQNAGSVSNGIPYVPVPVANSSQRAVSATLPSSLPPRPTFDMFLQHDSDPASSTSQAQEREMHLQNGTKAMGGSNHDVVANRKAIRMANMTAAEALKAEMSGLTKLGRSPVQSISAKSIAAAPATEAETGPSVQMEVAGEEVEERSLAAAEAIINTQGGQEVEQGEESSIIPDTATEMLEPTFSDDTPGADSVPTPMETDMPGDQSPEGEAHGIKRKLEDVEAEEAEDQPLPEEEEDQEAATKANRKVNPDGTVEQEDTVKLWEPGYRERYYQQKFGVQLGDKEFIKQITMAYIEGLSWVLHYYYQGTPSWQWFYPYHFAPFAADFEDISDMKISFKPGQPFKPFEQLMSVFPAASRIHIPIVYHDLMTDPDSPIIDFYPEDFEIDMNGKKMAWQGVALLPFIDERRLLEAMKEGNSKLTPDEQRRNRWGSNSLFVSEHHPLYHFLCGLYTKKKNSMATPLDTKISGGISGTVLADPNCVPGSTFASPLTSVGQPDINNDRSITSLYFYPKQVTPHRSVLLRGAIKPTRQLSAADADLVRRGGQGNRGRPVRDNAYSNTSGFSQGGGGNGGYGVYGGAGYQERGGSNYRDRRESSYGGPGNRDGYGSYGTGMNPRQSQMPPYPPQHHYPERSYPDSRPGSHPSGGYGGGRNASYGTNVYQDQRYGAPSNGGNSYSGPGTGNPYGNYAGQGGQGYAAYGNYGPPGGRGAPRGSFGPQRGRGRG